MMENLKALKEKRKEKIKRIRRLENELKEERDELENLDIKIAEIEGIPDEIEDIREESENFTKNIKKRARPGYKNDLGFNKEQDERTQKRQKRNKVNKITDNIQGLEVNKDDCMEKVIESPRESEPKGSLNDEIDDSLKEKDDEIKDLLKRKEYEYIRNNRKRKSKNEIEDLLEEISEEELKDLEFEERIEEEITDEISKLYYKLCRQEGFFLEGKKEMMKAYYDFGKEFEKELCVLLNDYEEEKTAISKLYKKIMEENKNHSKFKIRKRVEKARKIYRIILAAGGREKIDKLKYLNSEEYMKFNLEEIKEWIRNH